MYEFKLPDLGEGIAEGEILKWFVEVGEKIIEDDPLIEVETDKAAVIIPSPVTGLVVSRGGEVGDVLAVGTVLVTVDDGSSEAKSHTFPEDKDSALVLRKPSLPAVIKSGLPANRPIPAAPATRRRARELKVDLALVTPSGPGGRVTNEDLERYVSNRNKKTDLVQKPKLPTTVSSINKNKSSVDSPPIPFLDIEKMPDFSAWGSVEEIPLRSIRRKVARKMTTSSVLIPHVAHMDEADVTSLDALRRRVNGNPTSTSGSPTLLAFMIKVVVAGLKEALQFNASLDPDKETIIYKHYFNLGIAVDTDRGLIVPVLKNADKKSILEIATEVEKLAERARNRTLDISDLRGGTFTITNIGHLGGTHLVPTINYPEVAILGMGRAKPTPVVRNGEIVIRTVLPLTLAFDHRVADGADAARFMNNVIRRLENTDSMLLEI